MAHTPDHARRLLRELEPRLPGAARDVLERQCYHDPGFCDRFLAFTEDLIFREPAAGLEVARVTPRLTRIILTKEGPVATRSNLSRWVKALGLVGTAYRSVGQVDEAEKRYRAARQICDREHISPLCRAELYLRWATLRIRQRRFADASRFVEEALAIFQAEGNEKWIGTALAMRGAVLAATRRWPEAAAVLSEVLSRHRLTPRVEFSATGNLGYAILGLENPTALDEVLEHLKAARRLAGPRQSVQKSRLYWTEATACIRRGRTDDGERRYRKALAGFRKFGAIYEAALVALDLSKLLRFAGRWLELEELAAETFAHFQALSEDIEALAALRLWLDASRERELTEELLSEVKTRLESRARRNLPA